MAGKLITSTEELKGGMGAIQTDIDFPSIESFVDDAEINHIIPAIGHALYDILLGDTLNAKQSRAKSLLVKAEANFVVHYYVAFGAVQITEAGILVVKTERQLPASDKKLFLLRTQSRADGFKALEAAINYLEANRADFPEYIASDAHLANRRFYSNTTEEFSQGFELNGNAEVFASLKSVMATVEENYIDPLLGETVGEALRSAILAGSISAEQKKLLAKIAKATALLTIAEAIPYRLVNINPGGLVTANLQGNTDNVEASAAGDQRKLQGMMNTMLAAGMSQLGKLTKWLNDNAADFTGYTVQDLQARNNINSDGGGIYLL